MKIQRVKEETPSVRSLWFAFAKGESNTAPHVCLLQGVPVDDMGTRVRIEMLFYLLCLQSAVPSVQVPYDESAPEPYNIHVDKWNVTWTPGMENVELKHTVEYRSFDSTKWLPVLGCVNISSNFCDMTSTMKANHECVMLRVVAERNGNRSLPVQACSMSGGLCSPEFNMSSAPGSLTIHLTKNNCLFLEYAGHLKHRIYLGKEGEKMKQYIESASSESFSHLDIGQRYCAKVEFLVYGKPYGTPSCAKCEVIPAPDDSKRTVTIVVVVIVIVVVVLVPMISYVLIFQYKNIKNMVKPQYKIPEVLMVPSGESGPSFLVSTPSEELCDTVSIITSQETESDFLYHIR